MKDIYKLEVFREVVLLSWIQKYLFLVDCRILKKLDLTLM